MTAKQMRVVFDAFSQAENSTTRRFGGTGLGLTITKNFAEILQGELNVESEYGEGTMFLLRLPAHYDSGQESHDTQIDSHAGSGEYVRRDRKPDDNAATILVIDDEASSRDVLSRYFNSLGFRVFTAIDGKVGLDMARQIRPAAITLDVMMPSMDGWTFLQMLMADETISTIPVVVVSMLDNSDMGYLLGAKDHLTKPVDREMVRKSLAKIGIACPLSGSDHD